MKVLGVKQFHQKTFKLLDLSQSKFQPVMGDVPLFFVCVVYGYSGNGKTEFCMQLAKEFTQYGKVAWFSYEQRHGYDLQQATLRNDMEQQSGNFLIIDPLESIKEGVSLLEDLDNYLKKRNSPDFIFIDSWDYTNFTFSDYKFLKLKYGNKKTFVMISHSSKNGILRKKVSDDIVFDGGMGVLVRDFIAEPIKNRFGGFEPYVVFDKKARERNPAFFAKQVKDEKPKRKKA